MSAAEQPLFKKLWRLHEAVSDHSSACHSAYLDQSIADMSGREGLAQCAIFDRKRGERFLCAEREILHTGETEAAHRLGLHGNYRNCAGCAGRALLQKGSILGSPVQGYEIRIEKDTQELLIRGECVMKEYWKSTEPPPVDGYGYYHTGDLVEQGPGGLLAFAGRRDAFIKAGGRKVSLYGLEQQIRQIQGIRETAVLYSDSSHTLGVFYSGEADAHAAYIDILELMNHMLSQAQFRIIERSELPKLTNGKLDKQRLVAELH